jgi:hypothetical protein
LETRRVSEYKTIKNYRQPKKYTKTFFLPLKYKTLTYYFDMKTNLLSILLCIFFFSSNAQKNNPFFERRGYALSYTAAWYDAHLKEDAGVGLHPTRGYQASLAYYLQPSEHWGVELGIGMGIHPLDAQINLLQTQYPKLPFDLKNGRLHTEDIYFQMLLKTHYYHPLSPRLCLDYSLGASA